jgi:hypothetical protein
MPLLDPAEIYLLLLLLSIILEATSFITTILSAASIIIILNLLVLLPIVLQGGVTLVLLSPLDMTFIFSITIKVCIKDCLA